MPKKLTLKEFIIRSKKIHKNKYDYSKVEYKGSKSKVCIICPEHGEFWQIPSMHLQGQGCPKCYGNHKINEEEFIEKAKKIHGNRYDYSKVKYANNHTKVCIICPEHGEFWQRPCEHLRGEGCRTCSYKNATRRKKNSNFIADAKIIHNNSYDYSKVEYVNNKTKVCIICHKKDKFGIEHGEFWQRPDNHLHGQQCPKCAKISSKLEKKIKNILSINKINFEQEKMFSWLGLQRLDFYLPDYNIAIECQGIQHFEPVDFNGEGDEIAKKHLLDAQKRDLIKKIACEKNNVILVYYSDKNVKNKYLHDSICDLRKIIKIINNIKNEQ